MRVISIRPEPTRLPAPDDRDRVALLREQVRQAHQVVEQTLTDLMPDLTHGPFPGWWAHPLGLYAHAVCVEDATINALLKGGAPLFATTWADRVRWSLPPLWPQAGDEDCAPRVQVDVAALRQYAAVVFAGTDQYLASLTPEALVRTVDLSRTGLGQPTVAWVMSRFVLAELASACSALSSVKSSAGV